MKIYIARKEDTFWKIAKQNGVDLDELIDANPQISTPDMILPGMKIKIPQKRKQVKKKQEKTTPKNVQIEEQARQIPVMEEDDDKWNTVQPTLPYSMIREKKKYPLEIEALPESKTTEHDTDTTKAPVKNQSSQKLGCNPISIIRNVPRENIPEVNVLQVRP